MSMEEFTQKQLSDEELMKYFTVNVTTPNGGNIKLSYIGEMNYLYSYQIRQSGNHTFKATNSKGRTSEITVPVEIDETKIKTCTITNHENETKTISYIDGQTWMDLIYSNANIRGVSIFNNMIFGYFEVGNLFENRVYARELKINSKKYLIRFIKWRTIN